MKMLATLAALLLAGSAQGALAQPDAGQPGARPAPQTQARSGHRSMTPPGMPGAPRAPQGGRWPGVERRSWTAQRPVGETPQPLMRSQGPAGWSGGRRQDWTRERPVGQTPQPLTQPQTITRGDGEHGRVGVERGRWSNPWERGGPPGPGVERRRDRSGGPQTVWFGGGRQDHDHDRFRGDGGGRGRWEPHRFPKAYASARRFRSAVWIAPVGYFDHSWSYGEFLPAGWYAPDYQLDWWNYDLPEPPPGYQWVRVGDDVVLVDPSGRIVQVVHDLFY